MTGLDDATTSEKAAETNTNAEFSEAIEKPNVLAIGSIPMKNSALVGTGIGLPLVRFRCKSTTKAADSQEQASSVRVSDSGSGSGSWCCFFSDVFFHLVLRHFFHYFFCLLQYLSMIFPLCAAWTHVLFD